MNPRKILWFGQQMPGIDSKLLLLGSDYSVDYHPLTFRPVFIELLGKYSAGVIRHIPGQEDSLRMLRLLRSGDSQVPLVLLADNPSKSELIEAFRNGATDCVEEPIDSEGLLMHLKRYVQQKDLSKGSIILSILQDLGKKIAEVIYSSQAFGIVSRPTLAGFFEDLPERERIEISFFGQFGITINGNSPSGDLTYRERSLLAYLAFQHGKSIHRDRLAERFWADSSADSAINSMHVAMAGIRRYLEGACPDYNYISCQKQMYSFDPGVVVRTDVGSFLENFQQALAFERSGKTEEALYAFHRAFAYYRDEFLADMDRSDWVFDERDRLREKFILVLKTLGDYFVRYDQHDFAINLFNKILEVDDCYELAHRCLINSYCAKGMKDQASRQFQKCADVLRRKLDIKPSSETLRLYETVAGR